MSIELRRRCRSHLPTGPSLSIRELKSNKTINQKITFLNGEKLAVSPYKSTTTHRKSERADSNGNYAKTPHRTQKRQGKGRMI